MKERKISMDENIVSAKNMIRFSDWAASEDLDRPAESFRSRESRRAGGAHAMNKDTFLRRYGILLIGAALFTLYTILLSSGVNYKAEKKAEDYTASAVRSAVATTENHIFDVLGITKEQFQEMEKAKEEGKPMLLTGQDSWNAYVDREISAVAAVISKLSAGNRGGTDQMKLTEASCMLARVMNPNYPDSFEDVANHAKQWMFYDGTDKTSSQHDKDLAESIVRPYLESETIPNGLTSEMVYGSWSVNDFVLRDSYDPEPNMHTWRYTG